MTDCTAPTRPSRASTKARLAHFRFIGALSMGALMVWARTGHASGWDITTVVQALPGEAIGCVDLVLDEQDRPCVAACGELLRYVAFGDAGWSVEILDSTMCITDVSMSVDRNGHPAIAWADVTPAIQYAWSEASGWHREVVESGSISCFVALGTDSAGCAHLCYYDVETSSLHYALRTSEGWSIEVVDDEGQVGWFCDLALDVGGRPHVSYADYGNGDLKYAVKGPAGWEIQVVDADRETGWETSIRVDQWGLPHIVYYDSGTRELRYARKDGGEWIILPITQGYSNGGFCTSLALDEAAVPHAAFVDRYFGTLHYGRDEDGVWQFHTVSTSAWDGALALDGAGNPHLAFIGDGGTTVMHAFGEAGLNSGDGLELENPSLVSIAVFPNPCRTWTNVRFRAPSSSPVEILIHDLAGRCVERVAAWGPRGEVALRWDSPGTPGIYMVSLRAGGASASAPVTVMR